MASTIIHMCIAKKLNEKLNRDESILLLGSIAPDISKLIGQNKVKSHFYTASRHIPNINSFLEKYGSNISDTFLLGYYIHLYTDKLWFDGFIDRLVTTDSVKLLDGTIIKLNDNQIGELIYGDYTNLNIQLLDYYDMDLSLFYNDFTIPNVKMDEIPVDKLNLLIDNAGVIIKNSKEKKQYIFDIYYITDFIEKCVAEINKELVKLNILQ